MKLETILSSPNIAENLDDKQLIKVAHDVVDGFDRDKLSRQDWEERNADALRIALQVTKTKTFPWPDASNVHYPLVTIACMQFNARAYPALVPNTNVVKHRVIGKDPEGIKTARARRVSEHMNYQLMGEDETWEDEMDRLLMSEPLLGSCFKKTYFDPNTGENVSEMISADDFVVDYFTRSLETTRRKTHILSPFKNEIVENMRLGIWKEYDLNAEQFDPSPIQEASNEAQGLDVPDTSEDNPIKVLEQHCYLDLDEDGYDEPYIVTVAYQDKKVLRIVPRFSPENISMRKGKVAKIVSDEYFTKFGFIPSPDGGYYDIGFGILLSPLNESVNTIINQLIDAGTLANMQAGFISKGIRIKNGKTSFTPGEWKHVNATGDDLRKGIVPLPVRDPSQTLFQLLGLLIEAGQKIGSVSEMMIGESPGQNQPATTTMAVLEQGLKVYSAIIKRNHRSLTSEYRKIYTLNGKYLNPTTYYEVIDPEAQEDQGEVYRADYHGDKKDISPASDPNIVSGAQRLAKAEAVLGRAQANPIMYNMREAERRYLEAVEETGIDTLLKAEDQIEQPVNEEMELKKAQADDESKRAWMKMDIDAQESVVNIQKKIADTERSYATVENAEGKLNLDIARYVSETELNRAKLIAEVIKSQNEKMNNVSGAPVKKKIEARAMGGEVKAGQPYLVGEQGAEVVVPDQDGEVIPNHEMPNPPQPQDPIALSGLAQTLSTEEGYEVNPYPDGETGIALGNGINLAKQSADKFRRIGIPEEIINKIDRAGYFGKSGKGLREYIKNNKSGLTEDDVAIISNFVTEDGSNKVASLIPDWDSYTPEQKALPIAWHHQYGDKAFGYDAFEQFKNKDWDSLRKNLENWSEKGQYARQIEKRRGRESTIVAGF